MIEAIDHLVLTVRNIDAARAFYARLDLPEHVAENGRVSLQVGHQKINLHEAAGPPILPRVIEPTPGSADFCFVADQPLADVMERLRARGVLIESGPADRQGARGPMRSIYLRDPDGNLVEIAEYPETIRTVDGTVAPGR